MTFVELRFANHDGGAVFCCILFNHTYIFPVDVICYEIQTSQYFF